MRWLGLDVRSLTACTPRNPPIAWKKIRNSKYEIRKKRGATDDTDRLLIPCNPSNPWLIFHDLLAVPVVDNLKECHVVGVVKRSDIAGAYLRYVHGSKTSAEVVP
jgi:hypothetical protein